MLKGIENYDFYTPNLHDIELELLMSLIFEAYQFEKKDRSLYRNERGELMSKYLITNYHKNIYELLDYRGKILKHTELMNNFKEKYILNENQLELVHEQAEIDGLGNVYDYIRKYIDIEKLGINLLLILHQKLYSLVPYSSFGGCYRNEDVYLFNTGVVIPEWREVPSQMGKLNEDVIELSKIGIQIGKDNQYELILNYINECLKLKAKIIEIHPFRDGNGRIARAFVNFLFKLAGILPVYVIPEERVEYQKAMNKAIVDKDFESLNKFYYYKICDSIWELDFSERTKKYDKSLIKRL